MWMSDKPLVQEELADSLSTLVNCFNCMDTALLYTKCTLRSLAAEWYGIDRYRLDKFEMVREFDAVLTCFFLRCCTNFEFFPIAAGEEDFKADL